MMGLGQSPYRYGTDEIKKKKLTTNYSHKTTSIQIMKRGTFDRECG